MDYLVPMLLMYGPGSLFIVTSASAKATKGKLATNRTVKAMAAVFAMLAAPLFVSDSFVCSIVAFASVYASTRVLQLLCEVSNANSQPTRVHTARQTYTHVTRNSQTHIICQGCWSWSFSRRKQFLHVYFVSLKFGLDFVNNFHMYTCSLRKPYPVAFSSVFA